MVQTIAILKERYPQLKFVGGAQNLSAILDYNLDFYIYGFGEYAIVELFKYFKREFNTLKIIEKNIDGRAIKAKNKRYTPRSIGKRLQNRKTIILTKTKNIVRA